MSQERPRRSELGDQETIKYGDFSNVSGEVAPKPIAPSDAATMQSAESQVLGGQTRRGGAAAVMESAANFNKRAGVVGQKTATNVARNKGVTVSESKDEGGKHVISESIGGQVVGEYMEPNEPKRTLPGDALGSTADEDHADELLHAQAAPEFTATDNDLLRSGDANLNPGFVRNEDIARETYVSSDMRGMREDGKTDVISSVPGGMGASMAGPYGVNPNK